MQAVLIAAGRSSRFWPFNHDHKSTFPLAGKPLLWWTLESLADEGRIEEAIVVHSPASTIPTLIPSRIGSMEVRFAVQEEPIGTGNALYQARPFVSGQFALVWPDMVNAGPLIARIVQYAHDKKADGVLVGAPTDTPWIFGIIEQDHGRVTRVVEKPARGTEHSHTKRVGIELFNEDFFSFYDALSQHHEADLVDAINEYAAARNVALLEGDDIPVLKYPWDVFSALDILADTGKLLVQPGAVVEEGAVLEGAVFVGEDARIAAGATVIGPASIGAHAVIATGAQVCHAIVGEGTLIQDARVHDSILGAGCTVGSGAVLTPQEDRPAAAVVKGERVLPDRVVGAMVGNDTVIEPHAVVEAGVLVGGNAAIGPEVVVSENIEDGDEVTPRVDE